MKIEKNLKSLAKSLDKPLKIKEKGDVDLCADLDVDVIEKECQKFGFRVSCKYKKTNTLKFCDSKNEYEFTSFRTESYLGGGAHGVDSCIRTSDIFKDAKRRDFKCNAIYYDIKKGKIVDPLGGVEDVKNKVLSTANDPEITFYDDGLRLMRLCRFSSELGFSVEENTLRFAKEYASNLDGISKERITAELDKILVADGKYKISKPTAHYDGLKLLKEIGLLEKIFPMLVKGDKMPQPTAYHKYDVLEHSLRACLYADKSIRLVSLLHDVGKPYCYLKYGNYHGHEKEGEILIEKNLKELKYPNSVILECKCIVGLHMYDMLGEAKEFKVRKKIRDNADIFDKLMLLKIADYKASCEKDGEPLSVTKWKKIYNDMKRENVPFSLKELAIKGGELEELGLNGTEIRDCLNHLLDLCLTDASKNEKEKLVRFALNFKGEK